MKGVFRADVARGQLARLATLTDVAYAVGLVLVIQWLPLPEESAREGQIWLGQLFADHAGNLLAAAIALAFIIIYWIRSNTLLTALDRTDTVHTACSIASVLFLLFLLYMVRISDQIVAPSRRAGESAAVALIGIASGAAWWWARKKGLVREGTTAGDRLRVQVEAFTEPLTALVTIPLAFVGELAWNLGWLAYIPIAALLRRRGRARGV